MVDLTFKEIQDKLQNPVDNSHNFESDSYVYGIDLYKIFKRSQTRYNKNYLSGKIEKSRLLELAFKDDVNIVSPKAIIWDDAQIKGIAYPYIENSINLYQYISKNHPSSDKKLELFKQISCIMKRMHASDCFHGDMWTGNILINKQEQLFFIDMDNASIGGYFSDCRNSFVMKCADALGFPTEVDANFDRFSLFLCFLHTYFGKQLFNILLEQDKPGTIQKTESADVDKYISMFRDMLNSETKYIPYISDIEI